MSEISEEEFPRLLLDIIPETAEYFADKYGMPAPEAVRVEDTWTDVYDILTDALMEPIIIPELRSDSPDLELLQRCFDFTEQLMTSKSGTLKEAVYFQVIEALLGEDVPFQKAFPYMGKKTWERTVRMLKDYEVDVPGVTDR
ncbi:hypothetical protein KBZ10_18795 [Streptomyces sp. F63]|uniref:DUF7674 family protein n=1 Tax=Streptomyces sp. F63 TaxID=2824887 RepID=UPI001B391A21|nr:hypothetical protein [Streptomyces sp. F63]MBQ0986523.1 hypothetical protein [Streptomyces sp. F63]